MSTICSDNEVYFKRPDPLVIFLSLFLKKSSIMVRQDPFPHAGL